MPLFCGCSYFCSKPPPADATTFPSLWAWEGGVGCSCFCHLKASQEFFPRFWSYLLLTSSLIVTNSHVLVTAALVKHLYEAMIARICTPKHLGQCRLVNEQFTTHQPLKIHTLYFRPMDDLDSQKRSGRMKSPVNRSGENDRKTQRSGTLPALKPSKPWCPALGRFLSR